MSKTRGFYPTRRRSPRRHLPFRVLSEVQAAHRQASSPMFKVHAIEDKRPGKRLKIVLAGRPRAQQRPRIGRALNENHRRALIYNPSRQAQNEMRQVIQEAIRIPSGVASNPRNNGRDCFFPEASPLKAVIKFFMPRPKNHFRRNSMRSSNFLTPTGTGRRNHISRPDIDNMVKFVLDSMQGIVYDNDSHIVSLVTTKSFDNRGGCNGRVSIEVFTQDEDDNMFHDDIDNSLQDIVVIDDDDDENTSTK